MSALRARGRWTSSTVLTLTSPSGLLNIYGIFQTYYENELLRDSSPSAIAWIGSAQSFCLMSVGVFIGPLYDAGYMRSLLVAGTLLVTLGFMMTSICYEYWQVLLAQGVCVGLGTSCLSIPMIALVPLYFTTRRARAMAIATVGSSLGATLYPLMFQGLQPRIGFGWTLRLFGCVSCAMCCFALAVMRPRYKPGRSQPTPAEPSAEKGRLVRLRTFIRGAALGETTYIIYCVAVFFSNVGYFEPIFYLEGYALRNGLRGEALAAYLLAILNASSVPGRIALSFVADRVGALTTYTIISALSGASMLYWISVSNAGGNVAFAVLYGIFSGGVVSLAPVVLAQITPDLSRLGTRLGVVSILKGIGSLGGPPIAGAILDATNSYLGVQLFGGFALLLTASFSSFLWVVLRRRRRAAGEKTRETRLETRASLEQKPSLVMPGSEQSKD